LAAGAGVALAGVAQSGEQQLALLALGVVGLLWLGLGLALRWSAAMALGVVLLGGEQALRLALGPGTVDPWTPVYAAGLLLTAELAWWSIEPRVPAWSDAAVVPRRLGTIVGVCAAGAVVAALIVLAAGAPLRGGLGLELVGVAAAIAAVGLVATIARRPATEPG
jgi:hypothetical protein